MIIFWSYIVTEKSNTSPAKSSACLHCERERERVCVCVGACVCISLFERLKCDQLLFSKKGQPFNMQFFKINSSATWYLRWVNHTSFRHFFIKKDKPKLFLCQKRVESLTIQQQVSFLSSNLNSLPRFQHIQCTHFPSPLSNPAAQNNYFRTAISINLSYFLHLSNDTFVFTFYFSHLVIIQWKPLNVMTVYVISN